MFYFIQQIKTQFSSNFNHFFAISILSVYPITYFIGTGIVNLSVVLIDLVLIIEIIKNKKYLFFKNIIFYYLCGLWLILLLNLTSSIDPQNSLGRSVGFIRYIFFVMAIIYYFNVNEQKYKKIILSIWSIIFLIISIDLIYEFFLVKIY